MPFHTNGGGAHDDSNHQGSAKKGIASGVASLDAGALLPTTQLPTHAYSKHDTTVVGTNTYVGNDSANRALAHGMGRIPNVIFLWETSFNNFWIIIGGSTNMIYMANATAIITRAVTAADATNFYVGTAGAFPTSANVAGTNYGWRAL